MAGEVRAQSSLPGTRGLSPFGPMAKARQDIRFYQ